MVEDRKPMSSAELQRINERTLQAQMFTPDHIYIELGLMKDLHIGTIYTDLVHIKDDEEEFARIQGEIVKMLPSYQTRRYDTIDQHFGPLGYDDTFYENMISQKHLHDHIFMLSPPTQFLYLMIRHLVRNQNHSVPGEKYTKDKGENGKTKLVPIDINYVINTYPLTLSQRVLERFGQEMGEIMGVNISFISKHPTQFDQSDWDLWLKEIDCFYLNSMDDFCSCPIVREMQSKLVFAGIHHFVRKRFPKRAMAETEQLDDFDQQIQRITGRIGVLLEFAWIQNNDVRLTSEAEDVPMDAPMMDPI